VTLPVAARAQEQEGLVHNFVPVVARARVPEVLVLSFDPVVVRAPVLTAAVNNSGPMETIDQDGPACGQVRMVAVNNFSPAIEFDPIDDRIDPMAVPIGPTVAPMVVPIARIADRVDPVIVGPT
jgi:hypothetical protein